MQMNPDQTRMFLNALSSRATATRTVRTDYRQLNEAEKYVLAVMNRKSPVQYAAFLVNVMRADQRL